MRTLGGLKKFAAPLVVAMSCFMATAPAHAVTATVSIIVFEISVTVCGEVSPGVEVCQVLPG